MLVAHGGVLDVLYRIATGQDLQARAPGTWATPPSTACCGRPRGLLVGWSDTRHLDDNARDETHTWGRQAAGARSACAT